LHVALTDDFVTPALIKRHIKMIGDTYSNNWSYDEFRRFDRFVEIRGICCVPDGLTWDLGFGAENIQLATVGTLMSGQEDGSLAGFYAYLYTETNFLACGSSDEDDETIVFVKAYPCHQVPFPANW
jgi:hypothetical protein